MFGRKKAVSNDKVNRQSTRGKRLSKRKIFLFIFVCAVFTIIYVNNVVRVQSLMKQNRDLKQDLDAVRNENALLKASLNKLQSPERITAIAQKDYGMTKIETAPIYIPTTK